METPMGITCDKHNIAHKTDHLASQLSRDTLSYLEKFDRYDSQELLACASSNWLLSNEDFRLSSDPPAGMIRCLTIFYTLLSVSYYAWYSETLLLTTWSEYGFTQE